MHRSKATYTSTPYTRYTRGSWTISDKNLFRIHTPDSYTRKSGSLRNGDSVDIIRENSNHTCSYVTEGFVTQVGPV